MIGWARLVPISVTARRGEALLFACWAGFLFGLMEAAIATGRHAFVRDPNWIYSWDVFWMAPLVTAVIFGIGAIPLLVFSLLRARVLAWPLLLLIGTTVAGFGWIRLAGVGVHPWAAFVLAAGAGLAMARLIGPRTHVLRVLMHRSTPVLVGVAAIAGAGLHVGESVRARRARAALPAAHAGSPNVLLIILDTVRKHSMSLHGYARSTTPRIDSLATGGVVFDHALAPSSWTLPSHAALFTGRLPSELSADWFAPLDGTAPTLAEALNHLGYETIGIVANLWYTGSATGLARGFHEYRDHPVSLTMAVRNAWAARRVAGHRFGIDATDLARRDAARVTTEFLDWLDDREPAGRPFFAFLNYFDAHDPYRAPLGIAARFADAGGPTVMAPATRRRAPGLAGDTAAADAALPPDLAAERDRYDAAIAWIDEQVGRLASGLRERGVLDRTIVIITSDHGELFGEKRHNLVRHGNSLYHATLAVPLVMLYPGAAPAGIRVSEPVEIRALAATVLELVDGSPVRGELPGTSLARTWTAPAPSPDSTVEPRPPILAELTPPPWGSRTDPTARGPITSLISGSMHYLRNGDGSEELYDVANDPWERIDLSGIPAYATVIERFRTWLAARR